MRIFVVMQELEDENMAHKAFRTEKKAKEYISNLPEPSRYDVWIVFVELED